MKFDQKKIFRSKYAERPDALIIFGGWNFKKQLGNFLKYLKNVTQFQNFRGEEG